MSQSRSDREQVYVSGPDWWSRIVAIGSLAVAGTALYWGYLQDQRTIPDTVDRTAEIKSVVSDEMRKFRDEANRDRQQFESQIVTALNDVDQRVKSLADDRSSLPSTSLTLEEPITLHSDTPAGVDTDIADSMRAPEDRDAVELRPELIEVFAVLRVDDLADRPTLVVRNRGNAPARITHVRFEPTMDFGQVPAEVAETDFGSTRDDRLLVRFLPADNLAVNPNQHGTYQRALDQPFEIGLDEDVDVQVVIANPTHRQFGLRGKLILLADDEEIASFENVAVPFTVN